MGATFQMGRAFMGQVRFTPDGAVGLVAQDDGTLGVFTFGGAGGVTVVHAGFSGSFYAADVVMDPAGDGAWVLDAQWRENGGGIYRVSIGCDGPLTDEGRVAPAKLPNAFALLPDGSGRAVMIERGALEGRVVISENTGIRMVDFEGSGTVTDLGVLDLGDGYEHITGAVGVQP